MFDEKDILKNLRENSYEITPGQEFADDLLNKLTNKMETKKQSFQLFQLKFILPIVLVLVTILSVASFLYFRKDEGEKKTDDSIISDDLLNNPEEGEIIVSESLKNDPKVEEYVNKVGGKFVDDSNKFVNNEFNVTIKSGTSKADLDKFLKDINAEVVSKNEKLGIYQIRTKDKIEPSQLDNSIVASSEQNAVVTLSAVNDPEFSKQWALPYTEAPNAWDHIPANAPEIRIGVVDTGACSSHADLQGKYAAVVNVNTKTDHALDKYGHGCQVSGVIAATVNNSIGIAGVNPKVKIISVKMYDDNASGTIWDMANAILKAQELGATIINISSSTTYDSALLKSVIDQVTSKGVIVVASAGNSGTSARYYPASYTNVIGVGSIDKNGSRSWFSNYGENAKVYAPGGSIYTTSETGGYEYINGTSFSAPYVAGMIALEKQLCRNPLSTLESGKMKIKQIDGAYNSCPNQPPVFTNSPSKLAFKVGETFTYQPTVSDPEKNTVTFRMESTGTTGLQFDKATGKITWAKMPEGKFVIKLYASDGKSEVLKQFTIEVSKVVAPTPKPPTGPTPLVSSFFTNAQTEYNAWKAANPTYACAATMLEVVSTKVQDFEVWYCTNLSTNVGMAIQKNNVTGAEIPVKFSYNSSTCGAFVNYAGRTTTATGYVYGMQCLINAMTSRNLP